MIKQQHGFVDLHHIIQQQCILDMIISYWKNQAPGSGTVARRWSGIMTKIHEGLEKKKFEKPSGLVNATICKRFWIDLKTTYVGKTKELEEHTQKCM